MTRTMKIFSAGAAALLLGSVAAIGVVQARDGGHGMSRHHAHAGWHGQHGHKSWHKARGGWHKARGHKSRHKFRGHRRGMDLPVIWHVMKTADGDDDGKITQAEIDTAYEELFSRHDANDDGNLDLQEYEGLYVEIMQQRIVRSFQKLDPDGDAGLTMDEVTRRADNIVERFDRNDDGALSRDDRRHRWSRHKHRGGDTPMRGKDKDENKDDDRGGDSDG